jgi:hypothetical protein
MSLGMTPLKPNVVIGAADLQQRSVIKKMPVAGGVKGYRPHRLTGQQQGCPGAWIEYSTVSTCARRRGDRIARRFPPLWSIEELEACFVVRDHSGQVLAYVR